MSHVLLSLAAFVVTIGVLVAIHEWGHLIVARMVGVRVLRYSVGFGPRLWRRTSKRSGIEYQVAAIPFGGYVKMLDEREIEVPDADKPYAFNRAHPWRRIAILFAGPGINVVFAVWAYWLVFMLGTTGIHAVISTPDPTGLAAQAGLQEQDRIVAVDGRTVTTLEQLRLRLVERGVADQDAHLTVERPGVGTIHKTMPLASGPNSPEVILEALGLSAWQPPASPQVMRVQPASPAAEAGIEAGDRILTVAGQAMTSSDQVVSTIASHPGTTLPIEIERVGQTREVAVTLATAQNKRGHTIGHLGAVVGPSQQTRQAMQVVQHYGPIQAISAAFDKIRDVTALTVRFTTGMFTGRMSASNLGGPVAIADTGARMAALGVQAFISFLALVSLSLALLNLIPIPVLDGGQIVLVAVEWLIRRPLPMLVQQAANGAGMAAIFLLMGLAFYNDIVRVAAG